MKKRGETQGLHPSRDIGQGPLEYDLPYGGNDGIAISGRGMSGHYFKDEELLDKSGALTEPAQGRLFDPAKIEGANRAKLGRQRFDPAPDPFSGDDDEAVQLRDRALLESRIPTKDLQSRKGWTPETELRVTDEERGSWQGWYRGPATSNKSDIITVRNDLDRNEATNTFVHESGHRKHLGELPANSPLIEHPRKMNPDPLKEGVADAYADRYGGSKDFQVQRMNKDITTGEPKFGSYAETGYSTDANAAVDRDWHSTDRALYAATRAHASETGEQPHYTPTNVQGSSGADATYNPTVDATLHHLLTTSPHAAQALQDTNLSAVGEGAVRRHKDRMLLHRGQEVQGALFDELRGKNSGNVGGYIANPDAVVSHPGTSRERIEGIKGEIGAAVDRLREDVVPHHMQTNQFGEKARSIGDVYGTLNVHERQSASRGFI